MLLLILSSVCPQPYHALATAVVGRRDPGDRGGVGSDASARRHDQVRPEPDGRLQPADSPEEHRTVRGVRRSRHQRRRRECGFSEFFAPKPDTSMSTDAVLHPYIIIVFNIIGFEKIIMKNI